MIGCLSGVKTAKDFFEAKETSANGVTYFIDRSVLLIVTTIHVFMLPLIVSPSLYGCVTVMGVDAEPLFLPKLISPSVLNKYTR